MRRAATLALLLAATARASPSGWRGDGSGHWTATPPEAWSATVGVAWSTPLGDWSNASPVVAGPLVCAAVEPTTLVCLDRHTGEERWRAPHDRADVVVGAEREALLARAARLEVLEAELATLRTRHGAARRAARAGAPDAAAELEEISARMNGLRKELDATEDPRTPPTQGMVGWSSPTPATDGAAIFALFANGVVAAHEPDGRRRFARWLGAPSPHMLGWEEGHAASPVVREGVLVVPFGRLRGLDAHTGETRWEGRPWPHYGSPSAVDLGGRAHVVTPAGELVRVADGAVLVEGLADMWFLSPVVAGHTVFFLEARSDAEVRSHGGVDLKAWRLHATDGAGVRAELRWVTTLPATETFYTAPVVADGLLHAVTHGGTVWTVDAATGQVQAPVVLDSLRPTTIYSSPSVAGGRLFVTDELGRTVTLTPGPTPKAVATLPLAPTRASLAFHGPHVYARVADRLVALGPPAATP
ncbi:MAG: PQQ-binding-like beta-propeller repeat protein [Alphaproteobacteria bacterium]|nr:PQQ-binding-like beta-propeller repeat protein [Alphaproteobacteria bacterium]